MIPEDTNKPRDSETCFRRIHLPGCCCIHYPNGKYKSSLLNLKVDYGCKDIPSMFWVFQDLRKPLICVSPVNFSFQQKNPLKVDEKARGDFTRRKVQAYFATQQLDTSDARELFNLLDQDGDGEVESFGWVESWKWMVLCRSGWFGWYIHVVYRASPVFPFFFWGPFTGISIGFQVESSWNFFIIFYHGIIFLSIVTKFILVNSILFGRVNTEYHQCPTQNIQKDSGNPWTSELTRSSKGSFFVFRLGCSLATTGWQW